MRFSLAAAALALALAPSTAAAQTYGLWPQFQRPEGATLELEGSDGSRCRQKQGDRASASIAGLAMNHDRQSAIDTFGSFGNGVGGSGGGGGLLLSVPFGGGPVGDCRVLLQLQEARARLELARTLLEEGLIDQEQFAALGQTLLQERILMVPSPR